MERYRTPLDAAALADSFRLFAAADCAAEPLYAALARAIADRPERLAPLTAAPVTERVPVLLFAAVHDLLLSGVEHPLAAFYRSVVGDAVRPDVDAAIEPFDDFCTVHRDRLESLIARRTVQTNEVGRCAVLARALATLGSATPIALIDVGCSAGLNLLVDRYRYAYELGDGGRRFVEPTVGDGDCLVEASIVDGDPWAGDRGTPSVVRRIGIDRSPLDVGDAGDARWLRACMWPSEAARQHRLAAAMAMVASADLDLRRGDAGETIDAVVAAIDRGLRPVVFHSWSVVYFDRAARRRFADAVRAIVVARDGAWISAEAPGVVPGLAAPPLPDDADPSLRTSTVWHVVTRTGDGISARVVARSHAHGRWIRWSG